MRRLTKKQAYEVLDTYGDVVGSKQRSTRFYRLHTDLPVFKKVLDDSNDGWWRYMTCIANLIIPAGTLIHAGLDGGFVKCRAEQAKVHSIFSIEKPHNIVGIGKSSIDYDFKYVPGKTVKPEKAFSEAHVVCESGIHFFVDVQSALDYLL